jgi:WD repeat-containing protein 35
MINNRNKSVVKDMKWTNDGKKICIVYEDGAIIVGSVDGSRLWGKELNILLKFVEWSPDCRLLLFVTQDNDVLVYDSDGTRIKTMALPALREGGHHDDVSIAGLHWFEGAFGSKAANDLFFAPLCVVLSNGIVQMSRNEEDANPVVFSTDMTVKGCRWNPSGTVIAINGVVTQPVSSADGGSQVKQLNLIKFYDRSGNMLRAMRIPGENLEALTWDAGGLRLALAVDSFIYFANVRPAYTWCHFLNTVAYLYQRREPTIQFWNLTTNEMHPKYIPGGVHFLVACGDHCLIVTSDLNKDSADLAAQKASGEKSKKPQNYILQLRNGIGALVASKSIPFVPKYVCMGPNHVAAANERTIYTWQFQSAVTRAGMVAGPKMGSFDEDDNGRPQDKSSSTYASGAYHGKERMIDVESVHSAQAQAPETFRIITESLDDPISCICTSDRHLMIGRRSGSIVRLLLPHLSAENVYQVRGEPFRLALSCMSSKLAIIDAVGILQLLDLEARVSNGDNNEPTEGSQFGQKIGVDRRDVWDIIWAEDNDDLLCFMEKTKMGVIRGDAAEEPVVSSGYLARFRDLEVRAVLLDEIFAAPEKPERDCVVDFETKALHELRELILRSGLEFAYNYALKNPHSRLFRILAEQALETGELTIAEKCFVNINDYHGIQLVKQLRSMPDKMKVKAEVAAYLQRFDEAETIYRDIDRKDLAIQLRNRIGDYNRVVQLLHSGGGSDKLLNAAWDKIAEHYADRFMWKKAAQYFQESRNFERLAECYYRLENFEELSKMRADISDGTPLLLTLANRFESVGMYEDAVDCYIR